LEDAGVDLTVEPVDCADVLRAGPCHLAGVSRVIGWYVTAMALPGQVRALS